MAVDPSLQPILRQVSRLSGRLDKQRAEHLKLDKYVEGRSPLPEAVVRAKVTRAYRMLMPMADAPWASLVVGSTQDRLEVTGITDTDSAVADAAWGHWQDNSMDMESKVAHNAILTDGRAAALVWKEPGEDVPKISLDNMATMVVEHEEGSRRAKDGVRALRMWIDDESGRPFCNLFTRKEIFKFQGPKGMSGGLGTQWEPRQTMGADGPEPWPLENPYDVLPVVEIGINRKLRSGPWPYARGEFAHCTGLIDRINLLTFLGLVVAFWMGFPLRGVVGERILKDDKGNIIPPFQASAPGLFQLENPNADIKEFAAADRKNLSVFAELAQLAMITRTPRHYFPMEGGMANLAADAIRASEGALHAKCSDYKPEAGEGWEQVMRLTCLEADNSALSPRAELQWRDSESRSLAERADAASKLKDVLPQVAIAELALNVTQDQWRRWQAESSGNAIANLINAAAQPTPGGNGNGQVPAAEPSGQPAG